MWAKICKYLILDFLLFFIPIRQLECKLSEIFLASQAPVLATVDWISFCCFNLNWSHEYRLILVLQKFTYWFPLLNSCPCWSHKVCFSFYEIRILTPTDAEQVEMLSKSTVNATGPPEHRHWSVYILILKWLLHLSLFISLSISVELTIKPVLHKDSLMCICRIGAIESNPHHSIFLITLYLYE